MKFVQLIHRPSYGNDSDQLLALADDGSVWIWLSKGEELGWYDFETCEKPFPKQHLSDPAKSASRKGMEKELSSRLAGRFLNERYSFDQVAEFTINWLLGRP